MNVSVTKTIILLLIALLGCKLETKNQKNVMAYCISRNQPYKKNKASLYLYIFKDKPFTRSFDDLNADFASVCKFSIDSINPSKSRKIKVLNRKIEKAVIFYGYGFNKGDFLEIKSNDSLISELKIEKDFAKKLILKTNYTVSFFRNKELHSKYEFNFTKFPHSTFYPIEIASPQKGVLKIVNFNDEGEYYLRTKYFN